MQQKDIQVWLIHEQTKSLDLRRGIWWKQHHNFSRVARLAVWVVHPGFVLSACRMNLVHLRLAIWVHVLCSKPIHRENRMDMYVRSLRLPIARFTANICPILTWRVHVPRRVRYGRARHTRALVSFWWNHSPQTIYIYSIPGAMCALRWHMPRLYYTDRAVARMTTTLLYAKIKTNTDKMLLARD